MGGHGAYLLRAVRGQLRAYSSTPGGFETTSSMGRLRETMETVPLLLPLLLSLPRKSVNIGKNR